MVHQGNEMINKHCHDLLARPQCLPCWQLSHFQVVWWEESRRRLYCSQIISCPIHRGFSAAPPPPSGWLLVLVAPGLLKIGKCKKRMMHQEKPAPMKSLLRQFVTHSLLCSLTDPQKTQEGSRLMAVGLVLTTPKKALPKSQWPGAAKGEGFVGARVTLHHT